MNFRFRTAWHPIQAALLLGLLGLIPAQAAGKSVQYLDQLWQIEDGLPGQIVRQVLQGHDGYLWAATSQTLTRFDGLHFSLNNFPTYEKDRQYLALAKTSDGSMWVSSSDGLARFKNGQTTFYTQTNGLPCNYILTVYEDRHGTIWIGATNGLAKFQNEKFIHLTSNEGFLENSVRAILEDHAGTLWVGTVEGLIEYREGHTIYHTQTNLYHNSVQCLAETADGSLWVGTSDGLDRYRNGVCTTYNQREGELYDHNVRALYEGPDGGLWIGSLGGLQRFHREKFERVAIAGDLAADYDNAVPGYVYSICGDSEGDIWVGTSLGLNRLKPQLFRTLRKEDGLPERQINSVLQDHNGDLWVGTYGGGLAQIHENKIKTWTTRDGLNNNHIYGLCEDHSGGLWVGTKNGGLDYFIHGKVAKEYNITNVANLADKTARVIVEDRRHDVWVGGNNGLSCLHNGVFRAPDLNLTVVKTILEDEQGNIWVGFKSGLARITDGQTKIFGRADNFPVEMVNALCQGDHGSIWVGTDTGQLFRLNNGTIKTCPSTQSLFTRILHIFDDNTGHLWITTQRGVFRLNKTQLETGSDPAVQAVAYGKLDGMKRAQCNGIAQPSGWKSADGQLWIPTIAGLVSVDVKSVQANQTIPKVVLKEVIVDGQPIAMEGVAPRLPPDCEIEFTSTALSLQSPEHILFQCRLSGLDAKWQNLGTRRTVHYPHLAAGNYIFQVRACNSEGLWNPVGASFAFVIAPYFYETGGFWLLGLIVVAGSVLALFRFRAHQHELREKKLTRLVEEKTRGLVETQQIVLRQERLAAVSQLATGIAHEFNNILTIIQGHTALLMENPNLDAESIKSLNHIGEGVDRTAKLTQQILAFSRKQIMQPQVLDLNAVAGHITQVLGRLLEENVRVCCDFDPKIPTIEADPGMIEQMVMNLAVNARDAMPKGGQLTIATANATFNQADVLLRPERRPGSFVQLSVTDTGCGMAPAVVNRLFEPFFSTKEVGKGTGLGLATVYGLVNQHQGWIEVDSTLGKGTAFRIHFPISGKPLPVIPEKTSPAKTGGHETILVVEDEPVLRELVREILQDQGYTILEAGNGVEAIAVWEKERQRIDLLLTDIIMPEGISGHQLAARFQADNPSLPVIFSTGHSREMIERNHGTAPGTLFLSKPYHPAQLSETVRECLDAARAKK